MSVERAIALLEEQQAKVLARSPQWMVGEQLKDICRQEPHCAELIAQDLENDAMSITEAEKKLKAFADGCQRHLKMLFSAEIKCHFSPGSIQVYTALITDRLVGLRPVKS